MTAEFEAETQTDLWKQLAEFMEVFEDTTVTKFGLTSDDVRFVVRKDNEENEYFELHYNGDNPKLFGVKKAYGQNKKPKGSLFPRRKDSEGKYLPDSGWVRYNKETGKEE
jgi:hypothetical protein